MLAEKKLTIFQWLWLIFLPIATYSFFRYSGFDINIRKFVSFASVTFSIILIAPVFKKLYINYRYVNLIKGIFVLFALSVLTPYFFWNQSPILSYRVTVYTLGVIAYFLYLIKLKPSITDIEKLIWIMCVIFTSVWLYGISQAPVNIFPYDAENLELSDARGIFRIDIPGRSFLVLGFFIALNRVVQKKYLFVVIALLLFILIVAQLTRQIIVFSSIFGLYFLIKKNKKHIFLSIMSLVVLYFSSSLVKIDEDSIFGNLINLTEKQFEEQQSGEENIRVTEYRYYFTEYSKNIFTVLFGNGFPHSESSFGALEKKLKEERSIYATDVGYANIYSQIGFIGLLLYFIIFYKALKQKIIVKYEYAKIFVLYMIFANIAASWVLYDGIPLMITLYILENNHNKYQTFTEGEIYNRNTSI